MTNVRIGPCHGLAQREPQTISELFREALRRDMAAAPECDALLRRTCATGKALGVATEADVERLSDESHQKKQWAPIR